MLYTVWSRFHRASGSLFSYAVAEPLTPATSAHLRCPSSKDKLGFVSSGWFPRIESSAFCLFPTLITHSNCVVRTAQGTYACCYVCNVHPRSIALRKRRGYRPAGGTCQHSGFVRVCPATDWRWWPPHYPAPLADGQPPPSSSDFPFFFRLDKTTWMLISSNQ
jgi:hypothetical protein